MVPPRNVKRSCLPRCPAAPLLLQTVRYVPPESDSVKQVAARQWKCYIPDGLKWPAIGHWVPATIPMCQDVVGYGEETEGHGETQRSTAGAGRYSREAAPGGVSRDLPARFPGGQP